MSVTPPSLNGDGQLQDPIREVTALISQWFQRFFWVTAPLVGIYFLVPLDPENKQVMWSVVGSMAALTSGTLGLMVLFRAFGPRRPTDVLYLRSFKNDRSTWPIRVAIQQAIGPELRLSGIRDPNRRRMSWLRSVAPMFISMKYCTPRYMDLEAGDDWRTRLWYSMQGNRATIIDLSETTPFVLEEIRLTMEALGTERIIFLGHAPQSSEEITRTAQQQLTLDPDSKLKVVIWPGNAARNPSRNEHRQFRREIHEAVTQILRAMPRVQKHSPEWCGPLIPIAAGQRTSDRIFGGLVAMQLLLGGLQYLLILALPPTTLVIVLGPFVLVNFWLILQNWVIYIYDVGVPRDRIKASIGLVGIMAPLAFMSWMLLGELLPHKSVSSQLTASEIEQQRSDAAMELAAEDQANFALTSADGQRSDKAEKEILP